MDGSIIIDKPEAMTSHDVVSRVRRIVGTRRVGHTGTLDPMATGVLVVCVGRATRLVQFLVGLEKEYLATVRLGFATDTQDITGKQISPHKTSNNLSGAELRAVLEGFQGRQLQVPPMFSAKKVGGERLYRAAREGREVDREPVEITVHSIELIESIGVVLRGGEDGTAEFAIRVRCSSGTYVRTLAHDIGGRLGCGAHLAGLRRTAVGHYRIGAALGLDELEARVKEGSTEAFLIGMFDSLAHLPAVSMDSNRTKLVANGGAIELEEAETVRLGEGGRAVRLADEKEDLIAVGEFDAAARVVRPRAVLKGVG
jgi:tRNA pseudouridine55 synthase